MINTRVKQIQIYKGKIYMINSKVTLKIPVQIIAHFYTIYNYLSLVF